MIETKLTITCDHCGKIAEEKWGLYIEAEDVRDLMQRSMFAGYIKGAECGYRLESDMKTLCKECAASYDAASKALQQGFMGGES